MMIIVLLFFSVTSFLFSQFSLAFDSLALNQTLIDDGETLVSESQKFELGFFSPPESRNRYVGIWFKNIPERTLVWVANKNSPLNDSSGILTLTPTGNIVIINKKMNSIIWTSNTSSTSVSNPILHLLDGGNLVLKKDANGAQNSRNYLWQSFDHPSDTLIPGTKLGWDLRNNQEWYLTSWKSLQDPSTGPFTFRVDPVGLPEIVLRQGSVVKYRSGPWDGVRFGGSEMKPNTVFKPFFVFNADDAYYTFENIDDSIVSRFVVNQFGLIQHFAWSMTRNQWIVLATVQADNCDNYGLCGSYGICNANKNPMCSCLEGFTPSRPQDWERFDWSSGCSQKTQLNCSLQMGFRKFSKLKLPDTTNFQVNRTARNEGQCEEACLRNCSCMAYATTDISGCVMWFGDLLDIRTLNEGGQDIYIRMPASELGSSRNRRRGLISVPVITGVVVVISLIIWYIFRKRAAGKNKAASKSDNESQRYLKKIGDEDLELPLFDLYTISAATDNFSFAKKIGEGGFGAVYKGVLLMGQEIAVKRLSKSSGQGLEEFKNEVILIAKLQHRNLVRLLGCCIHDEERMLIYEYMSNQSLDLFIFNETRSRALDWEKRFDIIVGIARGLLYLHRDSRLRIIHRDLKASNILLDSQMNPKISDFGLARTFGGDQHHDNTNRVMGTFGYMAPEYAIDGLFSVKSDVFSFGVLALEIVSGKKNRGFCHPDHDLNLLGHAWRVWNEGDPLKLIDANMDSAAPASEVLRCIHVALLCVQQRPDDRPTMSTVLLMLDLQSPMLPQPKQPGFYSERSIVDSDSSSTGKKPVASTEVTITLLQGR